MAMRRASLNGSARAGLRLLAAAALCALGAELWTACNKKDAAPGVDLVAKGRGIYGTTCIACHNPDPTKDGALGPVIKGSSLELVQARVLRGEYPAGYVPKRQTHIMQKLPLTEADVEAVHAFLNAP